MAQTQKQINLERITKHMTVRIPDRPQADAKPQLSWMGLKIGDLLENTLPLIVFTDRVYTIDLLNYQLQANHRFDITAVNSEGAEIRLNHTEISFMLESKDWKSSFKKVRRSRAKNISNK